jgi:hypothetical protein
MEKKHGTKIHGNFTIDTEVFYNFKQLTKRLSINKSGLIEEILKDWIEKNKDRTSSFK